MRGRFGCSRRCGDGLGRRGRGGCLRGRLPGRLGGCFRLRLGRWCLAGCDLFGRRGLFGSYCLGRCLGRSGRRLCSRFARRRGLWLHTRLFHSCNLSHALPCFCPIGSPIRGAGQTGLTVMSMCAFTLRGNPLSVVGACVICLGLSACSFAGLEPFDDDGATRGLSRTVGLSPKPAANTPAFVEQSRGRDLGYLPVGVTPPPRLPLKSAQQVEAELNALRAANEARAAAPRPASPFDGRVEPGYKPPPVPPIPASEPIAVPGAAKAKAAAASTAQPAAPATANVRRKTPPKTSSPRD